MEERLESDNSSVVGESTAEPSTAAEHGKLHNHEDKRPKVSKGTQVAYILVSVVTAILAIVVIVATINVFLFITYASFDQSLRQKGAVVLAASGVVTLCLLIAGLVAVRKSKRKTSLTKRRKMDSAANSPESAEQIFCMGGGICYVGSLLIIVAIVQAIMVGLTISMRDSDKEDISEAMAMSFSNNILKGPSRAKWNFIQYASNCCGVIGPEDYRDHKMEHKAGYPPPQVPPNVPISCCKSYDPAIPEKDQEQNRQRCRYSRGYYQDGCQNYVVFTAHSMAVVISGITIVLLVLELLTAVPLFAAAKKIKPIPPEPKPEGVKVEERKGSVSQNK